MTISFADELLEVVLLLERCTQPKLRHLRQ